MDVDDDKTQPTIESNANTDDNAFALCFSFFTALWNRTCNSEVVRFILLYFGFDCQSLHDVY